MIGSVWRTVNAAYVAAMGGVEIRYVIHASAWVDREACL
jgi:hypothetical protein